MMSFEPSVIATKNTVILNQDEIIEVNFIGNQNAETVLDVLAEIKILINQLRNDGKTVLLLTNINGVLDHTMGARKIGAQFVSLPFDKNAVYGGTTFIKYIAKFIINAAGRADKIQYFDSETAAKEWLSKKS